MTAFASFPARDRRIKIQKIHINAKVTVIVTSPSKGFLAAKNSARNNADENLTDAYKPNVGFTAPLTSASDTTNASSAVAAEYNAVNAVASNQNTGKVRPKNHERFLCTVKLPVHSTISANESAKNAA